MANPRQESWKPISKPANIAVDWLFNQDSYDKFIAGVEARDMDDRWDINLDGDTLRFYRSWTGLQTYNFSLEKVGSQYKVTSFNVEEDNSNYRRSDDDQEIKTLSLLLEKIVAVKVN